MKSVQVVRSNKKIGPNPQKNVKPQSIEKAHNTNVSEDKKPLNQQVFKQKDTPSSDKEQSTLKKIKSAELFFNKKFLGNKDQSKSVMIKNLLIVPKQFNTQSIIQLKTGNLGQKMKEIETIFKVQKKIKQKKTIPPTVMTDFELYMTKRDILKEKNQIIDSIRVLYEEDKKKLEMKKKKKKRKFSTEEAETKKQLPQSKKKPVLQKKQQAKVELQNQNLPQLLFPGLYEETYSTPQEMQQIVDKVQNSDVLDSQIVLPQKQEPKPEILKPFDDEYFQRKFEEKIVKNKINVDSTFSLKSLFKSFDNQKTKMNEGQFIKKELNQIENVAKVTIENFEVKEKINRQLYGQNTDFDKIESELNSKKTTPADLLIDAGIKTQRRSINWIIKECDSFKKKFNIRKAKSLKNIKK